MATYRPLERYSSFRRLALAQWKDPSDPIIHGQMWFDVTKADILFERIERDHGVKVTYGTLVGKAVANALAAVPGINGKVVGRTILLKDTVDVYYQVDIGDGADLTGTVVPSADTLSLTEIAQTLAEKARSIRSGTDDQYEKSQKRGILGRAPIFLLAWVLRLFSALLYRVGLPAQWLGATDDDPFGSCMVTNVGNFGIEIAYAPLVPWTRVPYIFLVGQAQDRVTVIDGEPVVRKMLPVGATIDHRMIDGARIGQMAKRLKEYIEDPNIGVAPPVRDAPQKPEGRTP
jgi:pyruvate/2-oxoglutarate dehydrogenase complex dihydrolipoamide acyltransferase (E2) component